MMNDPTIKRKVNDVQLLSIRHQSKSVDRGLWVRVPGLPGPSCVEEKYYIRPRSTAMYCIVYLDLISCRYLYIKGRLDLLTKDRRL